MTDLAAIANRRLRLAPFPCPNCGHGVLVNRGKWVDDGYFLNFEAGEEAFDHTLWTNVDPIEPREFNTVGRREMIRRIQQLRARVRKLESSWPARLSRLFQ